MVNAWSLAASVLDGTLDEDYPIMKKDEIKIETSADEGVVNVPNGLEYYDPTHYVDEHGDIHLATSKDDFKVDNYEHSDAWYDYNRNDPDRENPFTDPKDRERAFKVTGNSEPDPFTDAFDYSMAGAGVGNTASAYPSAFTTLSDNDDQMAHHVGFNYDELKLNIQANSPYNDGYTQDFYKEELKKTMTDSRNKYHEKEILKDVEEYVSRTYNGHYTGSKHEYRNVQTIDLMASRDLASDFCQANILKYGSRYGSKDGRNKKDLLKVIHYAMLLLHFDEHYGKPSMTSGNIDHTMP